MQKSLGACTIWTIPGETLWPSAHHPSLPWRWHFCCLKAKLVYRTFWALARMGAGGQGGVEAGSVSGIGTPSAQPTAVPIRDPASSSFLEPVTFFYPILPILWERSPNSSSVSSLLGAVSANPWGPILLQTIHSGHPEELKSWACDLRRPGNFCF